MFGIPFSFVKAGFWLGAFELVALCGLMVLVHLLYAKIILATPEPHRLPGYVKIYLGNNAEVLAILASFFGIVGSLLAYILVGSIFLNNVFQNFWAGSNEMFWAIAITISSGLVTLLNLKKESVIDSILSAALLGFLGFLIFMLFPQIRPENFSGVNLSEAFLPYGVLLFALAGAVAIPNVVALLNRDHKKIHLAVFIGTVIPGAVYFLFALAVVGAIGGSVSEESIDSLKTIMSGNMILLLSLIGFLSVYDSYIILNANAQALLKLDFRFPQKIAWILATAVPLALYVIGLQDFILIIGASGAIAGGMEAALIVASYHKIRQNQGQKISWFSYSWKFAIIILVVIGVIYELWRVF